MTIDDPATLAEVEAAFAAYEAALVGNDVAALDRTVIPSCGRDFATASTLFRRAGAPGRVGRQTQSWARLPEGWRIVAAHVSVIAEPG